MMGRVSKRILLGAALLSTFACANPGTTPPPQAPPTEGYVVGAPDNLSILILPEPEIEREVRVRPDGMISIDLIGDVQAGGQTPTQIAEAIREKITRFKRDAAVSVTVVDSPSQFVTIFGEVAMGEFTLCPGTPCPDGRCFAMGAKCIDGRCAEPAIPDLATPNEEPPALRCLRRAAA